MPSPEDFTNLRRRQPVLDEKHHSDNVTTIATSASPAPLGYLGARVYILLASVALSLFIYFRSRSAAPLPEVYALCSSDGANIYTIDDSNARVECLVVREYYFVYAGSLDEVKARWNGATSLWNASSGHATTLEIRYTEPGQIIVPGLSDSHAHILEYGATKLMPIEGAKTIPDAVQRVKDYVLTHPDIRDDRFQYVEGWGWDHTQWPQEGFPSYKYFEADPIVADRLIILQSKDGHAMWVSRKVVESMGPLPMEVDGGVILRDSEGNPTGVFLDNAQDLIKKPKPTYETLERRFMATVQEALKRGLTAIHDAGLDPISLEFFRKRANAGKLPIRIYGMTYFNESADYWGDRTTKIVGAADNTLTIRSIKVFADGALRSGGAALYEPYADHPTTRGVMRISPETLNEIVPKFMRDGWQVNVHAIGDRANGVVLDAFEAALQEANVTALRPRLEHAQILTEADMVRFGDLGVIASIQPTHAISDMWYAEERLGAERMKGLYAFRSIIDHGARITLGTDFPVEDLNPLATFYAAVTRLSPDGSSPHGPGGWFPEQRMTREETLKGMTIDPAYASFTETTLGSIAVGKRADYIVLSQNIMTVPANQILDTKVIATVIDGRPVYGEI
ncbi:amidohydrolase family-domain-containing protein [Sparassis latifolia]|uniref:Amidohydrolase 3 domain-containing protein n=1 Tax=Sparassis crispa TaxID=139825 RepID=A0A401GGN7_9APHY|nr:hypothetical protein SCP_0310830 [Sparassis crispa]GBE81356.1 hypothetical protein SCP_0310830 [Sparassis crispa]